MVVSIMALLAGLLMPRALAIFSSVSVSSDRKLAFRQIASLGFSAYMNGEEYILPYSQENLPKRLPLQLPAGWTIESEKPIYFHSNGICEGGELRLLHENSKSHWNLSLEPPFCVPRMISDVKK